MRNAEDSSMNDYVGPDKILRNLNGEDDVTATVEGVNLDGNVSFKVTGHGAKSNYVSWNCTTRSTFHYADEVAA